MIMLRIQRIDMFKPIQEYLNQMRSAPITHITDLRDENFTHSREIIKCGDTVFPYHNGLLIKKRNRSLEERIFFFMRSPHFKKGYN